MKWPFARSKPAIVFNPTTPEEKAFSNGYRVVAREGKEDADFRKPDHPNHQHWLNGKKFAEFEARERKNTDG